MSYDSRLAKSRDLVRFLIGDTSGDPDTEEISDDELDALLVLYPVPACAAVQALQSMVARTNGTRGTSGPVASKSVDGISVSYATASKGMTRGDLLDRLRKECARRSQAAYMFDVSR